MLVSPSPLQSSFSELFEILFTQLESSERSSNKTELSVFRLGIFFFTWHCHTWYLLIPYHVPATTLDTWPHTFIHSGSISRRCSCLFTMKKKERDVLKAARSTWQASRAEIRGTQLLAVGTNFKRAPKTSVTTNRILVFSIACGSSLAWDPTWAIAATWATAVTTQDP